MHLKILFIWLEGYFFKLHILWIHTGIGRIEPVPVEVKTGRGGLGREQDQQRKKVERTLMYQNRSAKRQKMEGEIKQTFMRRLNEKMSNKNVERDFYKCQKVCEQLDSQTVYNS